jgi:hypothetical protein
MRVVSTSVTKQTGDMVYSGARRQFLSFGLRTTMLYALERESDHGSTSSVSIELSEEEMSHQSRFDNFRFVFNNERPHEGLNNQVPASLYHPGSVRLPRNLPEFTYP